LSRYGAYVVDDTASDSAALIFEDTLSDLFVSSFNQTLDTSGGPWYDDLLAMFQALQVVTNNRNGSVGGGGTPGVALAPPICDDTKEHHEDSKVAVAERLSACAV
jgi:hypothetical protein